MFIGSVLSWFNDRAHKVIVDLNAWIKEQLDRVGLNDFRWSSIQLNVDTVAKLHRDRNNVGPSLILVFGSHSGGGFQVKLGGQRFEREGVDL